ncbi:uncharacterized protein LOC116350098 [Contarinia nasturtii]|uniref:uncharacterized protein LOC116343269 n=1 Tax=Contarinia nasturtii TaxID=265458 RepID=UPI0012D42D63|nr:uncharacterized protein LOC116343269 [Contarinia nasturtii]XP_031637680.1 uncharacterized protein LOC116350098 [Contarinia nasturtii]
MPKIKRKQATCWEKLEKTLDDDLPECIKICLESAGYDTIISLKQIDAERIREIEAHLTEYRSWENELVCCNSDYYRELADFKFKPGHKVRILAIPKQIEEMATGSHTQSNARSTGTNKKETNQSDEDLVENLISNLMAFMEKCEFPLPVGMISTNNIRNFHRGTDNDSFVCKCRFACPFCEKTIPITFKKFWMSSNATTHLKTHVQLEFLVDPNLVEEHHES